MANGDIDAFLTRHGLVQNIVDSEGFKGKCATSNEMLERAGISKEELSNHLELFSIDEYVAHPLEGVSCSRDAIQLLSKRLATAME